jgi:hypothetical protein
MATINNNNTKSALQQKYAHIRKEQCRLESMRKTLVSQVQLGKVINNYDAKIRVIDIEIEKYDIEANVVRLGMVEESKAAWKASEADRKAEALLRKAEAREKREAEAKAMSVDKPFAKLLNQ